ncbi:MAG TPA: hypothetical protein VMU22_07905 [Rhizomicrobium sp.]|nr:hypothetical protein [Rhizomicrobium sp.]
MDAGDSLTGVWQGFYSYPRALAPVQFTATLIESQSWLTGTTHEPMDVGPNKGETIYATLSGSRDGMSVTFDKTYDGSGGRTHTIHYEGTLSEDGTEIEGRWIIRASWAGRFLMIRSGRTVPAEKVAALAKA